MVKGGFGPGQRLREPPEEERGEPEEAREEPPPEEDLDGAE
jgi:hypothetical protein